MSTTILLGNGFNYSLRNFITENEHLRHRINNMASLWSNFDELLDELLGEEHFNEQWLRRIYDSFSMLRMINIYENEHINCLEELENHFNTEFIQRIWDTIFDFITLETNDFYTEMASYLNENLFNNITPYNIIREQDNTRRTFIYTTNYDGLAEMVFSYDPHNNGNRIRLPDMFRQCTPSDTRFNCFSNQGLEHDITQSKLLHLHGSYKFFVFNNREIKIKRESISNFTQAYQNELEPIIIFNVPELKEFQIQHYLVLNNYFYSFIRDLQESRYLVIWGQSLNYDPHIERLILEYFVNNNLPNKRIYIITPETTHRLQDSIHRLQDSINNNNINISIEFISAEERAEESIFRSILETILNLEE